jgi:hypothetical protein
MKLFKKDRSNRCGLYALAITLGHGKHVRVNGSNRIKGMQNAALFMRISENFRDDRGIIRSRDY